LIKKNCFFALCQNQEWGPQTANILLSNEEIFLQASALWSYLYDFHRFLVLRLSYCDIQCWFRKSREDLLQGFR
jgi:hypothetical protein